MSSSSTLFTIGHSNHEWDRFVGLLREHAVSVLVDVRSSPFSRYSPQFNRDVLCSLVERAGMKYLFMGLELGARREEREVYVNGMAGYDHIAQLPAFRRGLARIEAGARMDSLALMCAEKDPLTCHRAILICRHLSDSIPDIQHILEDGSLESLRDAEARLLRECRLNHADLFRDRCELLSEAYDIRGRQIAYVEEQMVPT